MEKILVIGAGTMGSGISMWFAQQGVSVQLFDIDRRLLDENVNSCHKKWDSLKTKNKFNPAQVSSFKENLSPVYQLKDCDPNTSLVVEAIVEKIEPKIFLFNQLDKFLGSECIFATNTSGLSVDSIRDSIPKSRQKFFIGLHFFNPATIMKLVEIVSIAEQFEIVVKLKTFFQKAGKVPVACKDRPGFICNRIARNYYGESFHIAKTFNKDVFLTIDQIMREIGGFKMGPYELMDLIGIDINLAATENVWEGFDKHARFNPHEIQVEMVKSGKLGNKSGSGFLNGEKIISPPSESSSYYKSQVIYDVKDKVSDQSELIIDLSIASLEEKINLYRNLKAKSKIIIADLSTYSFEAFNQLLQFIDGSVAYKFRNKNKAELILKSVNQKIISSINKSLSISVVVHTLGSGHIFSRIISMIFNEAQIAFEEGLTSKEDIDKAMKFGLNYPQGPLEWRTNFREDDIKKVIQNLPSFNPTEPISRYKKAKLFE